MRYATPERLLERLTDLRFLSIDFLNTFLLTYKVFTDGVTVLKALKRVYYDAEPPEAQTSYPTTSDVSLLVYRLIGFSAFPLTGLSARKPVSVLLRWPQPCSRVASRFSLLASSIREATYLYGVDTN